MATKINEIHRTTLGAFCVFLLLSSSLTCQGKYTLDQVLAKMDEVHKTFHATTADIERTHVTVLVNDKDVSSGKFYYMRRGKQPRVKLELSKPAPQYLLIDRGKLQLYMPNLQQVQEASVNGY